MRVGLTLWLEDIGNLSHCASINAWLGDIHNDKPVHIRAQRHGHGHCEQCQWDQIYHLQSMLLLSGPNYFWYNSLSYPWSHWLRSTLRALHPGAEWKSKCSGWTVHLSPLTCRAFLARQLHERKKSKCIDWRVQQYATDDFEYVLRVLRSWPPRISAVM